MGPGGITGGVDPTPLSIIMRAKTKPAGVSDQRWRMELARRKRKGWGEPDQALKPILVWGSLRSNKSHE